MGDLSKHVAVKHLNGDLRALILVQSGVGEIDKKQLKESIHILKRRTKSQLESVVKSSETTESNSDSTVESSDGKDVKTNPDDNTSGERRKSSDDKLPSAISDRKG